MSREIFSAPAMRQLLRKSRICTLSTLDREDGTPYGSLANLATDVGGEPLLLLSRLAWHTQNLLRDGRASVLVSSLPDKGDALVGERVTVLGNFAQSDAAPLRQRYLAQHPESAGYIEFADFSLWRMTPHKIHGVAGFGRIDSYTAQDIFPDASELSRAEASALAQLNEDYASSINRYVTALLGGDAGEWRIVALDSDGALLGHQAERLRLNFLQSVHSVEALRQALSSLAIGLT